MLLNAKAKSPSYQKENGQKIKNHLPKTVIATPAETLYTVAPACRSVDKVLVCPDVPRYLAYKHNRYRTR